MRRLAGLALRTRLAVAFVGVAVLAVGLATLLSNRGLHPRVSAAARARLDRSAAHLAEIAVAVYRDHGGWTPTGTKTLGHLASLGGLRVAVAAPGEAALPTGRPGGARSVPVAVVVGGRKVGTLLVTLARYPGRVYSRFELINHVQGYEYEGYERTIDAHVKNLRKKIEPDPRRPRYVETVFGVGYRFAKR